METHSLKITKVYKASMEQVFNAWADKEQMVHWMGPGDVSCDKVEMDFTPGGAYQIFMQTADGPMTAYGEYQEIKPHHFLSFTWGWRQNDLEGTLVSISLKEADEGTEMTLEHTNFPQKEFADHHEMGWNAIMDQLDKFLL